MRGSPCELRGVILSRILRRGRGKTNLRLDEQLAKLSLLNLKGQCRIDFPSHCNRPPQGEPADRADCMTTWHWINQAIGLDCNMSLTVVAWDMPKEIANLSPSSLEFHQLDWLEIS